jgi:hypothetical protein
MFPKQANLEHINSTKELILTKKQDSIHNIL